MNKKSIEMSRMMVAALLLLTYNGIHTKSCERIYYCTGPLSLHLVKGEVRDFIFKAKTLSDEVAHKAIDDFLMLRDMNIDTPYWYNVWASLKDELRKRIEYIAYHTAHNSSYDHVSLMYGSLFGTVSTAIAYVAYSYYNWCSASTIVSKNEQAVPALLFGGLLSFIAAHEAVGNFLLGVDPHHDDTYLLKYEKMLQFIESKNL